MMKIGFVRLKNGDVYADTQTGTDTLEGFARRLDCDPDSEEITLDFFAEEPPQTEACSVAMIEALVNVNADGDTVRNGLEWLLGRVYAVGIARGKEDILSNPLAEKIRTQLTTMGF